VSIQPLVAVGGRVVCRSEDEHDVLETCRQYSVRKSKHNKLSVIMLLIERHVSAYSKAIIRFNKLYETIYSKDLG